MTRKVPLPCHCDAGVSDEGRCLNCDQKNIEPINWGRWLDWVLAVAGSVIALLMWRWRLHP